MIPALLYAATVAAMLTATCSLNLLICRSSHTEDTR